MAVWVAQGARGQLLLRKATRYRLKMLLNPPAHSCNYPKTIASLVVVPFLTTLSALNNKVAKDIINTISEIVVLSNLKEPIFKYSLIESVGQESTKKRILDLAESADIDLVNLNIVKGQKYVFTTIPRRSRENIQRY